MQYIKKPIIIDAVQWNGSNHLITETFMKGSGAYMDYSKKQLGVIKIPTHGVLIPVYVGDYIIKGIKGEFYPCPEDIFLATHEPLIDKL